MVYIPLAQQQQKFIGGKASTGTTSGYTPLAEAQKTFLSTNVKPVSQPKQISKPVAKPTNTSGDIFQSVSKFTTDIIYNITPKQKVISPLAQSRPIQPIKPVPKQIAGLKVDFMPSKVNLSAQVKPLQVEPLTLPKKQDTDPLTGKPKTYLSAAPPKTIFEKVSQSISDIFRSPEDIRAQAGMLETVTGRSLKDLSEKDMDKYMEAGGNPFRESAFEEAAKQKLDAMGVKRDLTNKEATDLFMALSLPVSFSLGLIGAAPKFFTQIKALGKFVAVSTAFDISFQKITGKAGISELLPEDTPRPIAITVDALEFLGKAYVSHKIPFGKVTDLFTKQTVEKYGLPQRLYINPAQIQEAVIGGRTTWQRIAKDIGIDFKEWRKAVSKGGAGGVQIEIPTSKIVTLVDRPYWVKIKSLFGQAPSDPKVTIIRGKTDVTNIAGLLEAEAGKTYTPQELRNKVFETRLETTKEGKEFIKTAMQAQKQGSNITLEVPKQKTIQRTKFAGAGTTEASFKSSANVASDALAGLEVPSEAITRISGVSKSTQKTLPSNRTNFLKSFDMTNPSSSDYNRYYKEIQAVKPEFDTKLNDIAKESNGTVVSRIKTQESLSKKLIRKKGRVLGDMNDTHAGTIISEDINNSIEIGKKQGVKITTDYRKEPTFLGYKGVHGEVQLKNGALGEVQFNNKVGAAQKEEAHKIYDKWRKYIEYNGVTTLNDVLKRIKKNKRGEFLSDVQKSIDIYSGKIKVAPVKTTPLSVKTAVGESGGVVKVEAKTQSRVFQRLQQEHPGQLEGELPYDKAVLKTEFDKAAGNIIKDKQKAYEVAMGRADASEIESVTTNIEMAEQALKEGNTELYSKLVRNRSIAQTRRGQAIVAEKGSIEDNSTARYVKELLSTRLDNLGNRYLSGLKDGSTIKKRATEIIDGKVRQLEIRIKRGKLDTKTALKLLDELACIV